MCAEQNSTAELTRRRLMGAFLGGGILATFASFLYPVFRYFIPPPVANLGVNEVVAAKVGELKPNSGMIFPFGGRPGLLILEADGTYRALSATCTHLGCTVQYRPDLHDLVSLPQRNLQPERRQRLRPSAQTAHRVRCPPAWR